MPYIVLQKKRRICLDESLLLCTALQNGEFIPIFHWQWKRPMLRRNIERNSYQNIESAAGD